MTPDEARLITKGWLQSQSKIALVGAFPGVAFSLRGQISVVSDTVVGLGTSDGNRFVVDFAYPGLEFRYSQMREFPVLSERFPLTPEQLVASGLTVFFPPRDESEDDSGDLHFAELVEE